MRLHRALDGKAPFSLALWVSRICEEFACLPSQAVRELECSEVGWLEEVIEARHYARAKFANDADPKGSGSSAMRQLAREIEFTLVQEELDG